MREQMPPLQSINQSSSQIEFSDPSSLSTERPWNLGRDFHTLDAVTKIGPRVLQVLPRREQPLDLAGVSIFQPCREHTGSPFRPERNPSSLSARTLGSGCINASDGRTPLFILSGYPLKNDFYQSISNFWNVFPSLSIHFCWQIDLRGFLEIA